MTFVPIPPPNSPAMPPSHITTIHTSLVFDPIKKVFFENVTILVDTKTGAIANFYLRPDPSIPWPCPQDDGTIIDLRGKLILPGLVDSHTHIFLHADRDRPHTHQVCKKFKLFLPSLSAIS